MKKWLLLSVALILVLVLCTGMASVEPEQASATGEQHKITVEGSASVKVKPDMAYVNLGVQTESKEAKDAQKKNAEIMTDVLAAVKALGIAQDDIQTSGFNVNPRYNYNTQKTTGYIVTNNVVVTLTDTNQVSTVIDAAANAGSNSASISFAVVNPTTYYEEALQNALLNAQGKAQALIRVQNIDDLELGLPLEITELTGYQSYEYQTTRVAESAYDYDYAGASTPIQSGDIEISAKVQVIYGY